MKNDNAQQVKLKFLLSTPLEYGASEAAQHIRTDWPRYIRITDISEHGDLKDDTFASLPPDIAQPYMLSHHDLLFARSGATVGKSFLYDKRWGSAAFAGYLIRARFNRAIAEPRFVSYFCQSQCYWTQISQDSTHATIQNVNAERYGNLQVPWRRAEEQRRIANYLDAETTRIDALIAKKRRMVELADSREKQALSSAMTRKGFVFPNSLAVDWSLVRLPEGWRVLRLSQALTKLTNGYVGPTRDILTETGVKYIQSLHIKDGGIDFSRRPFFVSREWHDERPRIHLRAGDVLIVQTGDIGQVTVVPKGFGQASCHALQIARVRHDLLSGEFLGEYLRTPFGYQSLLSRATGALHPHLEGGIRDIPIVVPPATVQRMLLNQIAEEKTLYRKLRNCLGRQISLLREHRQALITAAVTGELEVARRGG